MNSKIAVILTLSIVVAFAFSAEASEDNLLAVKTGDWIEYKVTTTGNPTPIHNITWARLDVIEVEGTGIDTDIRTKLGNGTLWLEPHTCFNVATGVVGEGAIIPTNLKVGDVYWSEYQGNITVRGIQTLEVAGAQRTVLTGGANNTSFCWDKQTGVMVRGETVLQDCVIRSELSATNLWQPRIFGLETDLFYALVAVVCALTVLFGVGFIVFQRRKSR